MSDKPLDLFMAEIRSALDCTPRGAWMPSVALTERMLNEIDGLRAENAILREFFEAREKLTQCGLLYADTALFERMSAARMAVLALKRENGND